MTHSQYDLAAGFSYSGGLTRAPEVVLKGDAEVADRIVMLARRYGVPVVEDGTLSEVAQSVPLDTEIPETLYRAVAIVLRKIDNVLADTARRRASWGWGR